MIDSKRYNSTDSENMLGKIRKIYSRRGPVAKM
jgi:hypothetical protein